MVRSLWAAGLLLRRLRDERGILALVFVLVASTSFLFAVAPRLFNLVTDGALRHAAQVAPPAQRNVTLSLDASIPPGATGDVAGVRAYGNDLAAKLPPSVEALISEHSMLITTVRLYVPDPPLIETHLSLRYQDGLPDLTRLVDGRWPVDRGVLLKPVPPRSVPTAEQLANPDLFEAALSTVTASEIGARVGDRLVVTLDGSDVLVRGTAFKIAPTAIEIVGLYEPIDPSATSWAGDTGLIEPFRAGDADNPIAFATAYIPAATYPGLWQSGLPFHYEWRHLIDPQRLDAGKVSLLRAELPRLGLITAAPGAAGIGSVVVRTGLSSILDRYAAEQALAESVLSMAAIGPFALAAGAMAMVAGLLVRRRRATLALARGRGASGALVLGTQLWESTLVAGAAAIAGLLVAVGIVPARANPLSTELALAIGATAILLLVGATLPAARRQLGQLERDDPPVFRVTPRRLVIEMTIVVVAVAAALLLRQRGLTAVAAGGLATGGGTAGGAAGEVAQFDPLLAAVPVLTGLAAGILALRLYPLPIRALGWLAARRRDIVPVLSLRTIGRHPASANLPLLVLLLTAGFGAFSSVIAASLDHGQDVAAYQAVGADYRIDRSGAGGLNPSVNPAAIPGVEAVAPGVVEPSTAFSSRPNQRAIIHLEAIDPARYDAVVAGTLADPEWPTWFTATPLGSDLGSDANPIPAILSLALPPTSADLAPGDTFRMTVAGRELTFWLVERRKAFPGLGDRRIFAIVPLPWLQVPFGDHHLSPSTLWVRGPAEVAEAISANVYGTFSARMSSRYAAYAALHDAPLSAVVTAGYRLALVVAAGYMAITIIGALILSTARRTRDLAYLRTLGVTRPQALALTVMEHAPPVLLALLPGLALGIAVAALCQPGLGLATFVGGRDAIPLFVDWPALGLLVAALIAVVAAAVGTGTWLSHRARFVDALRIGED